MKFRKYIVLIAVLVAVLSCRQRDVRTVEIRVPAMINKACVEHVVKAVMAVPGVDKESIEANLEKRTISVKYESLQLAIKNIEFAIAEAGFAANEVPAKEDAAKKLPPECTASN
ncbi:MAG: heavy-metal-associated domain-containing protein [Lentisphaerae bacterium]|nr:heavy-metal-associated domain-containing protein [Lentisphaerota bacterium]